MSLLPARQITFGRSNVSAQQQAQYQQHQQQLQLQQQQAQQQQGYQTSADKMTPQQKVIQVLVTRLKNKVGKVSVLG